MRNYMYDMSFFYLGDSFSLLFSRRDGVYKLKASSSSNSPTNSRVTKLTDGKFIYGVDYDFAASKLFWTERDENAVR